MSRAAVEPTQPPGAFSSEVKRLERESDDSSSSSAEVKNEWNYTSAPTYEYATMTAERQLKLLTFIHLVQQFLPNSSQTMRAAILFSTAPLFQCWPRVWPMLQAQFQIEFPSTRYGNMKTTRLM